MPCGSSEYLWRKVCFSRGCIMSHFRATWILWVMTSKGTDEGGCIQYGLSESSTQALFACEMAKIVRKWLGFWGSLKLAINVTGVEVLTRISLRCSSSESGWIGSLLWALFWGREALFYAHWRWLKLPKLVRAAIGMRQMESWYSRWGMCGDSQLWEILGAIIRDHSGVSLAARSHHIASLDIYFYRMLRIWLCGRDLYLQRSSNCRLRRRNVTPYGRFTVLSYWILILPRISHCLLTWSCSYKMCNVVLVIVLKNGNKAAQELVSFANSHLRPYPYCWMDFTPLFISLSNRGKSVE